MRRATRSELEAEVFDVVVIGGGIHGTAIARDAAMRGLSVALVEKEDFGYGTTSRSSRLIHGGLRYLEMYDFPLVRESLREREILLRIAPHLVKPLSFLIPLYVGGDPDRLILKLGMMFYDMLSFDKSLPNHDELSKEELLENQPELRSHKLTGAMRYYDCQVDYPERLCLEHAMSAAEHGARVSNHLQVLAIVKNESGDMTAARVKDTITAEEFEIRASYFVNATGPWLDELNGTLQLEKEVRMSKGVHLIVPKINDEAFFIRARDGRAFFTIPWREYTMIGTTDTYFDEDLDTITTTADEIEYLLSSTRKYFPGLDTEVLFTMAGVRNLIRAGETSPSNVPREYRITEHGRLLSLSGGKMTTARALAEEVVDILARKHRVKVRSRTGSVPLPGGGVGSLERFTRRLLRRDRLFASEETIRHLVEIYGRRTLDILELAAADPELQEVIGTGPGIMAELAFGVESELVCTSTDFLLRRGGLGLEPGFGLEVLDQISSWLATRLEWDPARLERDRREYRSFVDLMRSALPTVAKSEKAHSSVAGTWSAPSVS